MKITNSFYILIFTLLVASCGLEIEVFLEPVQIVSSTSINSVEIILPANPAPEFRFYDIYYRIYLSDYPLTSVTVDSERNLINASLGSHYNTLDRYTIDDNISPGTLAMVFDNLKYYSISLRGAAGNERALSTVLFSPAAGIIRLDFTAYKNSTLVDTSGISYDILRAVNFTSLPADRLLVYSNELGNGGYISNVINADIQNKSSGVGETGQYAYISMYILASGIDNNYSRIISRPKHIGVFRLPIK